MMDIMGFFKQISWANGREKNCCTFKNIKALYLNRCVDQA